MTLGFQVPLEKQYKLVVHKASFKEQVQKQVLKYGAPEPYNPKPLNPYRSLIREPVWILDPPYRNPT